MFWAFIKGFMGGLVVLSIAGFILYHISELYERAKLSPAKKKELEHIDTAQKLQTTIEAWSAERTLWKRGWELSVYRHIQIITLTFKAHLAYKPLFLLRGKPQDPAHVILFHAEHATNTAWPLDYWLSLLLVESSIEQATSLRHGFEQLPLISGSALRQVTFEDQRMDVTLELQAEHVMERDLLPLLDEIESILDLAYSLEWVTHPDQLEHRLVQEVLGRQAPLPAHDPLAIMLLTSFTMSPHQRRQILQKLGVSEDTYPLKSPRERFLKHPLLEQDLLNDASKEALHELYSDLKFSSESTRILNCLFQREPDLERMLDPSYELNPEHHTMVKMQLLSTSSPETFARFIAHELQELAHHQTGLHSFAHQILSLSIDSGPDSMYRDALWSVLVKVREENVSLLEKYFRDDSIDEGARQLLTTFMIEMCRSQRFRSLEVQTRHELFMNHDPDAFSHEFFFELLKNMAFERVPALVERYKHLLESPENLVILEALSEHHLALELRTPSTLQDIHTRFVHLVQHIPVTQPELCQRLDVLARMLLQPREHPGLDHAQILKHLETSLHAYASQALQHPERRVEVLLTLGQFHDQASPGRYKKLYSSVHTQLLDKLGMSASRGGLSVAADNSMQGALSES